MKDTIEVEVAVELLSRFVEIDTTNPPGNEKRLAVCIGAYMTAMGFDVCYQDVGQDRTNIVAKVGHSPRKLIFAGHLDTVPVGDNWIVSPFEVVRQDNKLVGRGTADMKAAIACMICAAVSVKEFVKKCDLELILLFVADEEVNGMGTQRFLSTYEKGAMNMVVLGEPTRNEIQIAHRGVERIRVELYGQQAHSSRMGKERNVIYALSQFLLELEKENRKKQSGVSSALVVPSVGATRILAGMKDNVIPGCAECVLDYRTIPGQTSQSVSAEIEGILRRLFGQTQIRWKSHTFLSIAAAIEDREAAIVKCGEAAFRKTVKHDARFSCFPACCDMFFFKQAGLDAIICGPGRIEQAHATGEYVEEDQLGTAIKLYRQIVLECACL